MSKKRASTEANDVEQTKEGSESLSQKEDDAKRVKLDSPSDTTLQDLPVELLEYILVKAVLMEVQEMKLAKIVWKEKAIPVISRLQAVCSQWSDILATNFFRNELHRTFDGTAQKKIRLEILFESPIQEIIRAVTTKKDEMFVLCSPRQDYCFINVCDRNNLLQVKEVIPLDLPDVMLPLLMEACSVSDCVYLAVRNVHVDIWFSSISVLRISRVAEHQYDISRCITKHKRPMSMMSVSANGCLVTLSLEQRNKPDIVSIYTPDGNLQHEITLSPDIVAFRFETLFQKSDGNVVLAYVNDDDFSTQLVEVDLSGTVVRRSQCQTPLSKDSSVQFADIYGRIMIVEKHTGIELLDSELNLLSMYSMKQDEDKSIVCYNVHYDRERNEIMRIHYDQDTEINVLTVFRFVEE